ncbi:hypothetical protein H2508_07445 [Parahaliea sp. F7430]|uniref:Tetratricopeptide repeat protein n=1 Tax=Sediminihaliea albiluteola TaxID=2758564 RepID=A0A7W2TVY0_9GAMM|nr:hypothetical protein [Sediminihaliea albiluteola]MBA6412943.1 hypothetical protein [Sediminihaliea albiluteola]
MTPQTELAKHSPLTRQLCFYLSLLCLLAFSAWCYLPGDTGPVMLDDHSSLQKLSVVTAEPELARELIFGEVSGPLGRPVSMASFVYEKLIWGDSPQISKRVNIALHALNGLLVGLLLLRLFSFISFPRAAGLAVVLTALWLLAPILVSTVLYSVQRMTILSCLFMLLAVHAYIFTRESWGNVWRCLFWLVLLLTFFAAGMFAKENTAVVLPIILLMELMWFQFKDRAGNQIDSLRRLSYLLVAAGAVGLLLIISIKIPSYINGYGHRPFDLGERLMTEMRIVWDYIAQTFWPDIKRLGLYHDDYPISTSFTEPLSTLWSALGWLAVLGAIGLAYLSEWGRRLAFGLIWFLVGHSLESTFLPLELYFEHRNYFPNIAWCLVIGTVVIMMQRRWSEMYTALLSCLAFYILIMTMNTLSLAKIWGSRELLTLHQVVGHPNSFRANSDMAILLASVGDANASAHYAAKAHDSSLQKRDGDRIVREIALACMAGESVPIQTIESLGKKDAKRPISSVSSLLTLVRLIQDGKCPSLNAELLADQFAEIYLPLGQSATAAAEVYFSLAVLENALARYDKAYQYSLAHLALKPRNVRSLLMNLHFVSALELNEEKHKLLQTLSEMSEQGLLSLSQQQTLELYTEQ